MNNSESVAFNVLIAKFLDKNDEHLSIGDDWVQYRGIDLDYHKKIDWLEPVLIKMAQMGYTVSIQWYPGDSVGKSCAISKNGAAIVMTGADCVQAALQTIISTFNL